MGITRCCCEPGVESGQFYGPAHRSAGGPAVLLPSEADRERYNRDAMELLWLTSCETTGATWPEVQKDGPWKKSEPKPDAATGAEGGGAAADTGAGTAAENRE